MRLIRKLFRSTVVCDECRRRRHGYQLRCLEPAGHAGAHRWTPELLEGFETDT